MNSYYIEDLKVGMISQSKTLITAQMVENFAEVTGDYNPIHLDDEYASKTVFGRRIAHGMLIGGLISKMLGTEMPGEGCVYISQKFEFLKPVFIGDEIMVELCVEDIDYEKSRCVISTICRNQENKEVLRGYAMMSPKRT